MFKEIDDDFYCFETDDFGDNLDATDFTSWRTSHLSTNKSYKITTFENKNDEYIKSRIPNLNYKDIYSKKKKCVVRKL